MKKTYQAPKTLSIELQVEGVCTAVSTVKFDTDSNHGGTSNFSEKKDYSSEIWGD